MWGSDWWSNVEQSNIICIENHSWDHVHPTLEFKPSLSFKTKSKQHLPVILSLLIDLQMYGKYHDMFVD